MSARLCFVAPVALAFSLAGCGSSEGVRAGEHDAGAGGGGADDAGADDAGTDAGSHDAGMPPASGRCTAEAVVTCDCKTGIGTERCRADGSGWGACTCAEYGAQIAVSPTGDDSAAGTLAAPFRTLERAQTAVRALIAAGPLPAGGVVVWLRGGVYPRTSTFALTSDDSGDTGAPVVYRGYPGETARIIGGMQLDAGSAEPVTSASPVWSRLDSTAQGNVVSFDLGALGISDFGTLTHRGFAVNGVPAALELFIDGQRAPLGRWPDAGQTDPGATPPAIDSKQVTVYGTGVVPDVTGVYVMDSVQDGASSFTRQGQVGGKTWHLYRTTGGKAPQTWVGWFLTTSASGYPSGPDPFFYVYQSTLGPMSGTTGTQGTVSFVDPTAATNGFESLAGVGAPSSFTFTQNRAARWDQAPDPWVHGFFHYTWADDHFPVTVGAQTASITLGGTPMDGLEATLYQGGPALAYAYNLLEEITQPGEWYLDRQSGLLYLWPPANLASHDLVVSVLSAPLVSVTGARNVTFQEITFEASRTELVSVAGSSDNVQVTGCVLRDSGDAAADVQASTRVVFDGDLVYATGEEGVKLGGGDRTSLTAGGNAVQNSDLHDFSEWVWTYTPGVNLTGDGNVVQHNVVHGAPHSAIIFDTSSQQLVQYNDIFDVLQFTSDCGAIYAWADWGSYGNRIQYNYIHDIESQLPGDGTHAVYLDACTSGTTVTANVIVNVGANGKGSGLFHNGGHDVTMTNNVIVDSGVALLASSVCATQVIASCSPKSNTNFVAQLEALQYQQPPWSTAYPSCAKIPDDCTTVTMSGSTWLTPYGTVLTDNVSFGNDTFISADEASTFADYSELDNNLDGKDPLFVDAGAGDYDLSPGSPAFGLPGFTAIPFDSIGIER